MINGTALPESVSFSMAQKRMIDKKISLSEKLAELPLGAQLLYTWIIPHADDFGLIQGSPRTVKAQVMPMADVSIDDVDSWIDAMIQNNLLKQFEYKGKNFYYLVGFEENQTLRHDMQPYTVLPIEFGKKYEENWQKCQKVLDDSLKRPPSVTSSSEIVTEVRKLSKGSKEVSSQDEPARQESSTGREKDGPRTDSLKRIGKVLEETLMIKITNWSKQGKALNMMLKAGYTEKQIIATIDYMANEHDYFSENGFDLMNVSDYIPKHKAMKMAELGLKGGDNSVPG